MGWNYPSELEQSRSGNRTSSDKSSKRATLRVAHPDSVDTRDWQLRLGCGGRFPETVRNPTGQSRRPEGVLVTKALLLFLRVSATTDCTAMKS